MPTSAELKEHYDTHGYVIIPGLLTPSEHADLLTATDRAVARTRSWFLATCPCSGQAVSSVRRRRRHLGRAARDAPGAWGARLCPVVCGGRSARGGEDAPGVPGRGAADGWVFSRRVCSLQYLYVLENSELFNILVNPVHFEFALRWHRDDIKGSVGEDEERAALTVRHYGV